MKVEVKKYDENLDLAILVITDVFEEKFKLKNHLYSTGDEIYLIGNANNLGISIAKGIISKKEVKIEYNNIINNYIQLDAASTNGVSGGALLNNKGELIGIVTLRLLDDKGAPIYGYVYAILIKQIINFTNN